MHIVLYNPLSNKGTGLESAKKLIKRFDKKHISYKLYDMLEIHDQDALINSLKIDDVIDVVGGDGTLHQFVNAIRYADIKNEIWMYRAGRGNDFSRDHKGRYFRITDEVKALPQIKFGTENEVFINGCGIGIDAAVCNGQILNAMAGIKSSYYKVALHAFKTFKQFKITINVDGNVITYDDVWFVVVQNGKYFGGGMKVAPMAIRDDDHLDIVIAHRITRRKLLMVFPLIFIGKHTAFKKAIHIVSGKKITIDAEGYNVIQIDGEVANGITHLEVDRYWEEEASK